MAETQSLANVPEELKRVAQWVRWRYEGPDRRKIPYDCNGGQKASSTNPANWGTFEQAIGPGVELFSGIGFVFSGDDDFVGVDLDESVDENGELLPEARQIVERLNSYAEVSPSGRGVKVFLRGSLPIAETGRKTKANGFKQIEFYHRGRYFTVTGEHVPGTPLTVEDRSGELVELFNEYFPPKVARPKATTPLRLVPSYNVERCRKYIEQMPDAISGSGGHNATLRAACECFRFGLTDAEVREVMAWFNSSKCSPAWTDRELEHKLADARQKVEADGEFGCRLAEGNHRRPRALSDVSEPNNSPEHFTDLGNSKRLVRQHGENLRFTDSHGWLVWTGTHWERDRQDRVFVLGRQTVARMYAEAAGVEDSKSREALAKFALASESRKRLADMVALASSDPAVRVPAEAFDRDTWALNVQNGTLDLRTGTLRAHDRDDLISRVCPVVFDREAEAPRFLAFLSEVMGGDDELAEFLQRAVGHSLTGDISERALFLLYGTGCNGKSTFLHVIRGLLGEYSVHVRPETILARRGDAIPCDLARLQGARFVTITEIEEGRRMDIARVKEMTGGTDPITARFLRQNEFSFLPEFKPWVATNHKPVVRDDTDSIWDRIYTVPFEVRIQHADKGLPAKLLAEQPGILGWAVRGCLEWQRLGGLEPPEKVLMATADYRAEMDSFPQWLAECCDLDLAASATGGELRASYMKWCDREDIRPLSTRAFGERLTTEFKKEKGARVTYFGVAVRSQ